MAAGAFGRARVRRLAGEGGGEVGGSFGLLHFVQPVFLYYSLLECLTDDL